MDAQSYSFSNVMAVMCFIDSSASGICCDTLQLRWFVGQHAVKGLHHSYTWQPQAVREKMYVGSSGESRQH
jgi:hypothetical protein